MVTQFVRKNGQLIALVTIILTGFKTLLLTNIFGNALNRISWYRIVDYFTPDVQFQLGYLNLFDVYDWETESFYNYLTISFFIIFIAGFVLRINKDKRGKRIVRMSFGVLLIGQSVNLLFLVLLSLKDANAVFYSASDFLIFVVKSIFWIYLSYQMVKAIEKQKRSISHTDFETLDSNFNTNEKVKSVKKVVTTDLSQRAIHYAVDLLICSTVCTLSLWYLLSDFYSLRDIMSKSSWLSLWLLIIMAQLIYYVFFEGIFGATPGKWLTESYVVNNDKSPVTFKNVLYRSLVRLIPLEPFSFIGKDGGFHDVWTKTSVVKEEEN